METQKSVTVLACGLLLAAGMAGCSDDVRGAPGWSLEDRQSEDVSSGGGGAGADVGTEVAVSGEEVGQTGPDDTSTGPDTRRRDTGSGGADAGGAGTYVGWYRQKGESERFVPAEQATVEFRAAEKQLCEERVSVTSTGPDGPWSPSGMPSDQRLPVLTQASDGAGSVGFVRTKGTVQRRGTDGATELNVERAELEPCTTFETFGSCVVPRRGDRCFPDLPKVLDGHLKEWSLEQGVMLHGPHNTTTYKFSATFDNPNAADEESELTLTFQVPLTPKGDSETPGYRLYDVGGHRGPVQEFMIRSLAWGQSTSFEADLDGWIRLEEPFNFAEDPGTFKINVSGESEEGERFRLFGTFEASRAGRE